MGRTILLDLGAAVFFFGALVHHPVLHQSAVRALGELQTQGYAVPTGDDPVRVYPAGTTAGFDGFHAGGWRPGVITLRENPHGAAGPEIYLRHELMHEASFRTCGGRLPQWAEEAAAMSFSGELGLQTTVTQPTQVALDTLRQRLRVGAKLNRQDYQVLSSLLVLHGWPPEPCTVSVDIEKQLAFPNTRGDPAFSYILIHLVSGRTLDVRGDSTGKYPPGSLLKIPYAAALREGSPKGIGEELAASDSSRLLKRKGSFDLGIFRLLISTVSDAPLGRHVPGAELQEKHESVWRQYLGERSDDGLFPLEASLAELALMLRASLLYRPGYFAELAQNGFIEVSTLHGESEQDKQVLQKLQALSKTGTVSDSRGTPLVGHLMVAWPADNPAYLAVFRSIGISGAANLHRASKVLEQWSQRFPRDAGKVRVRLMSLVPRNSWEVVEECPSLSVEDEQGWKRRVSTCGKFRIVSGARGSRSERMVSGVLESISNDQMMVLETDPETYADSVLAAEAADLKSEARKALRAVIVWNATRGDVRHADTGALCDSTHCMVFQGEIPGHRQEREPTTDITLLSWLDQVAHRHALEWLPFSKGGTDEWHRSISAPDLQKSLAEASVLDVRRERTRSGDVIIHLVYPENEELVPCELFRNRLKLYSCPETIRYDREVNAWLFAGVGEGHGQGLSIDKARVQSRSGSNAWQILGDAYREEIWRR